MGQREWLASCAREAKRIERERVAAEKVRGVLERRAWMRAHPDQRARIDGRRAIIRLEKGRSVLSFIETWTDTELRSYAGDKP